MFFQKNTSPEVCDTFSSEWRLYQTEEIKEEHCYSTTPVVSGQKQASYWENAFLVAGLEKISESTVVSKFDIEKLAHHLENLRDSSGTVKFSILSAFMKCVLSISHENSAP